MSKQISKQLADSLPISTTFIERRIHNIRGQQVMLDSDLAELYQVPTKSLNLAVKRNPERFPQGFMFKLILQEYQNLRFQNETSSSLPSTTNLRSQIATSSYGGRRYLPYAFTEYGVIMLSSVLNSHRAIQMNITIVRAFIQLREMLEEYKNLSQQVTKIKGTQDLHSKVLVKVVKNLKTISTPANTNLIGFRLPK